ncbi:MAG TPA: glycosyltransferase family 2 protein [Bacteroidales bacterium]|nr:glycosyltransferase family 2 protein [Bacteroidales bacterium]
MMLHFLFWLAIGVVLYTYSIYILVLWILCARRKNNSPETNTSHLPEVTIVIAAHNEEKYVLAKYQNTLSLNYPSDKLFQIWVDDGSTDTTPELLNKLNGITFVSNPERVGKAQSINYAMKLVKTPFTVFTDANTFLSLNSIIDLIKHFENTEVGCVAGQKKVLWSQTDALASKGEGLYWRFESFMKMVESCSGSTLAGTGELYAIRTNLFKPLQANTILDDFEVSANIIKQGYKVKYENGAVASETGSLTVEDEKKRKVRIAAGCFQALCRHVYLLNPFKSAEVAFKFFSHKLLRWVLIPPAIVAAPLLNAAIISLNPNGSLIYVISMITIAFIYLLVIVGYLFRNRSKVNAIVTFPYYGFMMNITMLKGFFYFFTGKQTHIWEKVTRKADN